MATKRMSIAITKREYDFMKERETNLSRYGRFVANTIKPTDIFAFYMPSVAEDDGNYILSWTCEDIQGVIVENELMSIGTVDSVTFENGTSASDIFDGLPASVDIVVGDKDNKTKIMQGSIEWESDPTPEYNPESEESQDLVYAGLVILPNGVNNTQELSRDITCNVTVSSKATPTPDPDPAPGE